MNRREMNALLAVASMASLFPVAASAQQAGAAARLRVGMLIHSDMILLDLVGPLTVFNIMQADVRLMARGPQAVTTDVGLPITPTDTFASAPQELDVLFVPGGLKGTVDAMRDGDTLQFLEARGKSARFVTSVCTGSLLLGAAGLLNGYDATSHWYVRDFLAQVGARVKKDRVVEDRNRITGGGVTAGLDFGLTIAARLGGDELAKRIQLLLEYDPKPPFAAGSPEGAGKTLTDDILKRRNAVIREAENELQRAAARLKI